MRVIPEFRLRRRQARYWMAGALAALVVGTFAGPFLLPTTANAAGIEPALPSGTSLSSWDMNGSNGKYLLQIVEGAVPATEGPIIGSVTSDTTCEPDALGFSHCHNDILLKEGARITVVNTHLMNRYRCLYPGETVSLSKVAPSWVEATTATP